MIRPDPPLMSYATQVDLISLLNRLIGIRMRTSICLFRLTFLLLSNFLGFGERLFVGSAQVVEKENRNEESDECDAKTGNDHDALSFVLGTSDSVALGSVEGVFNRVLERVVECECDERVVAEWTDVFRQLYLSVYIVNIVAL